MTRLPFNTRRHGDGSGTVTPSRVISPLMGITNRLGGAGVARVNHHANSSDIAGAVAAARDADYAIVFVGASSGEGSDRASLRYGRQCEGVDRSDITVRTELGPNF